MNRTDLHNDFRTDAGSNIRTVRVSSRPPTMVAGRPGPEVYRRRRLVVAALAVLLGTSLFVLGGRATASSDPTVSPTAGVTYVVQPGDTLWAIAERVAPDADPRPMVHELGRQLDGSTLQVGQRLILPAS